MYLPNKTHNKEKWVEGTFFVYFLFADQWETDGLFIPKRDERATANIVNEALARYVKDETVCPVHDRHNGQATGFLWLKCLIANSDEKEKVKHIFLEIARHVAYEVGGLKVAGPYCHVGWYELN